MSWWAPETRSGAGAHPRRGVPWEVPAVWVLLAVVAVEIFVTYARLPAYELYHVSGSGLVGGASRALVDLNWPVALVAIAIVAVVPGRPVLRIAAAVLCAVVVVPGVVTQDDLDAKPINAVPALGVVLALAASWGRPLKGGPRLRGDSVRIVVAALVVIAAVPWIAADLGTSILGSHELWSPFGGVELSPKVHPGHHHGMVGALLALSALALSRPLPQVDRGAVRVAASLYLGLMLAYGLGNELQDFWLEQLVKRGATSFELPSIVRPEPTLAWAIVLVAGLLFGALFLRDARRPSFERPSEPVGAPFFAGAGAVAAVALVAVLATALHGGSAPGAPRAPAGEVAGAIVFPGASGGDQGLFRLPSGSREPFPLADQDGGDANPAWSRDGRIVFQSDREGGLELWLTRGNAASRRLTDSAGRNGEPAWSPDGTRIAFASTRAGGADLYVLWSEDRRLTRLTRGPADDEWPSWSPDGRELVFARDGDLFVIGADGGGLRRLTSGPAEDRLPAWSPDGRRIAYASARDGNEDLYVIGAGGGEPRRLTRDAASDTAPAWSRDGRYLAFVGDRDGRDQLYVMDPAGGVRRLTDEDRDTGRPTWR